jgi:hypothetical protein
MRLREWKYQEGEFSYGQRIAVGEILTDESRTWYQRLKACWRELYGWSARWMLPAVRVRRFDRLTEGLRYWVEREQAELRYNPTAEEQRAGLMRLNAEVGHMGTIKALAEKFGIDPDVVLTWQWGKVYGILRADLKEADFQRRLAEQAKRQTR